MKAITVPTSMPPRTIISAAAETTASGAMRVMNSQYICWRAVRRTRSMVR